MKQRFFCVAAFTIFIVGLPAFGQVFKFSEEDSVTRLENANESSRIQAVLTKPCKARLKNQKILVVIGQMKNGQLDATQAGFNRHVEAMNRRLQDLGLRTASQAQIQDQIKQAEIDAFFKNDADAALGASRRMAAQFVLRGLITTAASYNRMVNVNQVTVSMAFTLTAKNGKVLSQASAQNSSYAGQDVDGMALTLINEQADAVVAQLYSDYCGQSDAR